MTTAVAPRPAPARSASRVLPVARLIVANPWTTLIQPWLILAVVFVANLAIWAMIAGATTGADRRDAVDGFQYSGAIFFIFTYMLVVGVQAMNASFALALGLGASRRDFYLGTLLAFAGLSVIYAVGITVLAAIEDATGGWGLGGRLFAPVYLGEHLPLLARFWMYLAGLLFFFIAGSSPGAVFVRWGRNGLIAFLSALALLGVGGAAIVTAAGRWAALGSAVVSAGALGIATALLLPAVVGAAVGYVVIRRARVRD